ncbi:MAG: L-lysine 2,3-aminomutase [Chlamydiales bacterium]|nr:L-lysine 2,3-aminomutase [Chlamydiales bacterium]
MPNSPPVWKKLQKENFTSLEKLCAFLQLSDYQKQTLISTPKFPLNLPKRLAEKIQKNTLDDPIFKQFVPQSYELKTHPLFTQDPVGDTQACIESKLLQKYKTRALLVTTGACAMHCRYCFRRHFSYAPFKEGFEKELRQIQNDSSLREVILSGGDPLSLSNKHLKTLLNDIASISHIKRVRFHTRFPIGIPERIDAEFLELLESSSLQFFFVIHVNHPKELDTDILLALKKVQKLGIPVLNQWVLLKEINDTLEVLQTLCEQLVDNGIFPYYLHQLDRVEGGAHFEVDIETGKKLIEELNKRLSGYGVPKYVQEIPSEPSKTLIV